MRKTTAREKAEVDSVVKELNSLATLCGFPTTTTEDVMNGRLWQWSTQLGAEDYATASTSEAAGNKW